MNPPVPLYVLNLSAHRGVITTVKPTASRRGSSSITKDGTVMTSRRELLRAQAERFTVERLIEAKTQLGQTLVEYGKLTGRAEAFEAALLLHLLDVRDPRLAEAFGRTVPDSTVDS